MEDQLKAANTKYRQGDYQAAINILNDLPVSDEVALAKGYCYLLNKQATQAVPALQQVLSYENSLHHDKANWYLALAYVQIQDTKAATIILQKIIQDNAFKTAQAKEILRKLD